MHRYASTSCPHLIISGDYNPEPIDSLKIRGRLFIDITNWMTWVHTPLCLHDRTITPRITSKLALGHKLYIRHTSTKKSENVPSRPPAHPTPSSRALPQIVRNARLGPEIVDNRRRIPSRRRSLVRHRLEQALQLPEVLALAGGGALDEALPGIRVREAGVDDSVEDVVFGLDCDDGAVGAVLEILRLVLLGWKESIWIQYRWEWEKGCEGVRRRLTFFDDGLSVDFLTLGLRR